MRTLALLTVLVMGLSSAGAAQSGRVEHINPPTLIRNPAFTQVIAVTGNVKTVYVGGQDAVDSSGAIVGPGDLAAQAQRALQNVATALDAAGAKIEHVVKWNILIVQGQNPGPAFQAFQRAWGTRPNPPAITVAFVAALANPAFLVEIDAVAVVPQ
jgi:enamine deaminase RidA (YjgF/YER057c/UK114 family)